MDGTGSTSRVAGKGESRLSGFLCQRSPEFPHLDRLKIPPSSVDVVLLPDLVAGPVRPVGGAAFGAVQGAVGNAAFGVFHSSVRVHRPSFSSGGLAACQ